MGRPPASRLVRHDGCVGFTIVPPAGSLQYDPDQPSICCCAGPHGCAHLAQERDCIMFLYQRRLWGGAQSRIDRTVTKSRVVVQRMITAENKYPEIFFGPTPFNQCQAYNRGPFSAAFHSSCEGAVL